jgi:hypothetical protein
MSLTELALLDGRRPLALGNVIGLTLSNYGVPNHVIIQIFLIRFRKIATLRLEYLDFTF